MLLRFSKLFIVTTAVAVLIASCQKTDISETAPQNDSFHTTQVADSRGEGKGEENYSYAYFLDDVEVKEDAFTMADTTLFFIVEGVEGSSTLLIRAYTSEELMNNYGDSKGWRFSIVSKMEDHLYEYAVKSGALEAFEKTGVVPEWYIEYQNAYMLEMMGGTPKSLIAVLFEHIDAQGFPLPTLPLVGWPHLLYLNNEVSSFVPLLLGGVHIVYNKPFYKQKLTTFVKPGLQTVNFSGFFAPLNDKASSWLSFGL